MHLCEGAELSHSLPADWSSSLCPPTIPSEFHHANLYMHTTVSLQSVKLGSWNPIIYYMFEHEAMMLY